MSRFINFPLLFLIMTGILVSAGNVKAQNGKLIEGLFRTFAEAQLEKERMKRAEAQKRPPVLQPPRHDHARSKDPYQVQLPSGFGVPSARPTTRPRPPKPQSGRPTIGPGPTRPPVTGSINVRSREAADYAKNLVAFNKSIDPLINDLRRGAGKNPAIRALLPEAYSIAADGRALLQRCDGMSALTPIIDPYAALDARWRKLSFSLGTINGLSNSCTTAIAQCDRYCSAMCEQLQLQPQFNRDELKQVMLVAATYMQAVLDDLEMAPLQQNRCHTLAHDCRLLRQRLLAAAHDVHDVSYEQVVVSFNNFAAQWGAFAQQLYAINDPHLHRRLDRISECGDQTYGILWMSPPQAFHDVTGITARLQANLESVGDQVTLRAIAHLPPDEQIRFVNTTRHLVEHADTLHRAAVKKASPQEVQRIFSMLDQDWVMIQPSFMKLRTLNRGVLSKIDHDCQELRVALGMNNASTAPGMAIEHLLSAAASLEGTSDYIYKEIRNVERSLTPSSFRSMVKDAAREFSSHSKELHEQLSRHGRLSDPRYLERAQREAEHLLEGFEQLRASFDRIEDHGVSELKAHQLRTVLHRITPSVAQLAAALFPGQ